MAEKSLWTKKIESDPAHSAKFIARFRDKAARGDDIVGEARLVDAMAPRRARIFDAGCGSGRIGGELVRLGHTVVGVDVDPELVAAAREDHPGGRWLVGDLAELDLAQLSLADPRRTPGTRAAAEDSASSAADHAPAETFDVVVAAGNVLPFLAPSTRQDVLTRLRTVLGAGGRATVGFGAGRGYLFDDFFADAAATGWEVTARFRGWNLLPFDADSDFLVAVMAPIPGGHRRGARRRRGTPVRELGSFDPTPTTPQNPGAGATLDPMGGNSLPPLR